MKGAAVKVDGKNRWPPRSRGVDTGAGSARTEEQASREHSNVDRMLARSIASSFGAFSVTNDLKTDAEAAQELEHL